MAKKNDFKPCAYYCVSNWGGIEIEVNGYCDAVRYRWSYVSPEKERVSRWQDIKYDKGGRTYFVCHRRRYYLDEFTLY